MPLPALTSISLADQAYEVLLDRITAGEYPPGHALPELELVARLGISRTPVRQALHRLSEYGLVTLDGRRARVRRLSPADVGNIYHLRLVLEAGAVEAACGRLTPADFARLDAARPADPHTADEAANDRFGRTVHLLVAERSGNPMLAREVRRCQELVRLAHIRLEHARDWLLREHAEHAAIVEALRAEDRRRCVRAMRTHLRSARRANIACAAASRPPASPNP